MILKTNHDECSHALEQSFLPWQQLDFNMKIIFMTLVTTTLSESIVGENFDPHCEGSLNVFDTSGKTHSFASNQDGLKKLAVLNATVHGCGCFLMYKGKQGNSQSMLVSVGSVLTGENLKFKYIGSVRKITCPSATVPRSISTSTNSSQDLSQDVQQDIQQDLQQESLHESQESQPESQQELQQKSAALSVQLNIHYICILFLGLVVT